MQERIGWPSRCTVQAPHCASPQPKCGLLRPMSLRNAYSSGMSGSASITWVLPFTLSEIFSVTDSSLGAWFVVSPSRDRAKSGRFSRFATLRLGYCRLSESLVHSARVGNRVDPSLHLLPEEPGGRSQSHRRIKAFCVAGWRRNPIRAGALARELHGP